MKKILINSYYFFPENTPRAFRTTALAKELGKNGVDVILALPARFKKFDELIRKEINVSEIIYCGVCSEDNIVKDTIKKKVRYIGIKKAMSNCLRYLISDKNILYFHKNYTSLKRELVSCDGIISIGLPFFVHLGTYMYAKNKDLTLVADYGDPFSGNPAVKLAPYFKFIEKKVLKKFKFVSIPTEISLEYYSELIELSKVVIIPQGYDFECINLAEYKKSDKVTFAYAGIFYEKIRNPKILFEILNEIEYDFEFTIFTDLKNAETVRCLGDIPTKIKEKIIIRDLLKREECIYELSKMDFLINIENANSKQIASKIVDYSLAKRPILNVNNNFKKEKLIKLFQDDYSSCISIDIRKYNIKNVSKQFMELFREEI